MHTVAPKYLLHAPFWHGRSKDPYYKDNRRDPVDAEWPTDPVHNVAQVYFFLLPFIDLLSSAEQWDATLIKVMKNGKAIIIQYVDVWMCVCEFVPVLSGWKDMASAALEKLYIGGQHRRDKVHFLGQQPLFLPCPSLGF